MKKTYVAGVMVLFVYTCLADYSWDGLSWDCQSHGESSCESSPLSEMIRSKSTRIVGLQDRGDSDVELELTMGRRLLTAEKLIETSSDGVCASKTNAADYMECKLDQDPGGHVNFANSDFGTSTSIARQHLNDMITRRESSLRNINTYDEVDSLGNCIFTSGIASCAFQYQGYFITYSKIACSLKTQDDVFAEKKTLLNVYRYAGSAEYVFYKAMNAVDTIFDQAYQTTLLSNLVDMTCTSSTSCYLGSSNSINYKDQVDQCFGSV